MSLLDAIWHKEEVLEDWKNQLLIPLHMKGSPTSCDRYHSIALLSTPSKVFTKAILNHVKSKTKLLLCESQCGFLQWKRLCQSLVFPSHTDGEGKEIPSSPVYMLYSESSVIRTSIIRITKSPCT